MLQEINLSPRLKQALLTVASKIGLPVERITVYYHTGGPKQMEGFMKKGNKVGYWTYWNVEGTLIKRERYNNGVIIH